MHVFVHTLSVWRVSWKISRPGDSGSYMDPTAHAKNYNMLSGNETECAFVCLSVCLCIPLFVS